MELLIAVIIGLALLFILFRFAVGAVKLAGAAIIAIVIIAFAARYGGIV